MITVEIGANDVLVPIMYGIASAMGGPQVFEALLPMLEGDFRQMDASSFAALRENLDSLNITAQQRKALLQLLSSGVADICAQSQATTLANLEALLQELNRSLGVTVVIITHQMSVIEEICTRVAILDSGVVAEIGEVETVFSNPQSAAGRRLVSPDVALPLSTWNGPVARIAFNGNTSEEPIIASVAMEKGIKLSILGADTRNVDGKAFGTMLVSLPEDKAKQQEVLEYLNHFDGVTAEVIQ